nr:hypothetical protein [Staphylococcus aureus]
MEELKKDAKKIPELEEKIKSIEEKNKTIEESIKSLNDSQIKGHQELKESHKELKDKQEKVVDKNLEQTKILSRIEERYLRQMDVAQKNEEKTLTHNKWLIGAIWALVTVIIIAVITASVAALLPY